MKTPINGPYHTPKQRDKMNKELDKVYNERIGMTDQSTKKQEATSRPVSIEARVTMFDEPEAHKDSGIELFAIEHREGNMGDIMAFATTKANARLIVKAINMHDQLIKCLKDVLAKAGEV